MISGRLINSSFFSSILWFIALMSTITSIHAQGEKQKVKNTSSDKVELVRFKKGISWGLHVARMKPLFQLKDKG